MRLTDFSDTNNQEYVLVCIFIRGKTSLDNKSKN